MNEGKTYVFMLFQSSLLIFSLKFYPIFIYISIILVLALWRYLQEKDDYYTWRRYFAVLFGGILFTIGFISLLEMIK